MRWPAWACGLCVGFVTSGAIFFDRLSCGALGAAAAGDAAVTTAAVTVSALAGGSLADSRSRFGAALGALAGLLLAHALLVAVHGAPWFAEGLRQLVNDVVAALATWTLIVAFSAKRLRVACLVAGASVVAVYAATHAAWHLDRAPRAFDATVQACVIAQFFSVLAALAIFRVWRADEAAA